MQENIQIYLTLQPNALINNFTCDPKNVEQYT